MQSKSSSIFESVQSVSAIILALRAFASSEFDIILSKTLPDIKIESTGIDSSNIAIGPCFNSPAVYPVALI